MFTSLLRGPAGLLATTLGEVLSRLPGPCADPVASESTGAREGFPASEATPPRTRWDAFWDAFNRLPRPVMAAGAVALMAWAPLDPEGFVRVMQAYAQMPDGLATAVFGVAAAFFTTRHLERRLELGQGRGASGRPSGEASESEEGTVNPTVAAWLRERDAGRDPARSGG
ncbi:3TM-type holin [Pararhodospirillum oryzae]|uniref:Uncharacterized protein n=1 Tax=Pararhodospirillum oryzae TaxID=478448 RepID=A0A512H783_9PROT|nr:3TM-type holin [Pararhodospirillum oryzae]GEO81312.1 hypothetical protein ROR02_14430 [Pararhodospirillum oryzae]